MTIKIRFPKRAHGQAQPVVVEGEGMQGQTCDVATKVIRDALGVGREVEHKPEWHAEHEIVQEQSDNVG